MSTKKPKRTARPVGTDSPIVFDFLRSLAPGASVIAHAATDSMTPTIRKGDEIIVSRTPSSDIRNGDIIAYVRPDKHHILVHRVVRRTAGKRGIAFMTKGDNLAEPDPYMTPAKNVLGRVYIIDTDNRRRVVPSRWVRVLLLLLAAELCLTLLDFGKFMYSVYDAKRDAMDWYMTDPRNSWSSTLDFSLTSYYHPFLGWRYRPVSSRYVNVEADLSRRTTDNPTGERVPSVYFFGGSSMWGIYAKDSETIASYFVRRVNRKSPRISAINYGHLSYNNNQELMFLLELLKDGKRPEYVIFYDGCNDLRSAPERVRSERQLSEFLSDVNTIVYPKAALAYWKPSDLLVTIKRTLVDNVRIIRYPYRLVSPLVKRVLGITPPPPNTPTSSDIATGTVSNYRKNAAVVDALSHAYNFTYLFIWQPTIYDKPLTPLEVKYQKTNPVIREASIQAKSLLAADQVPNFFDLSSTFAASSSASLFTDECHVIPEANSVIADRIGEIFERNFTEN